MAEEIFREIEIMYRELLHTILDDCFETKSHIKETPSTKVSC